jgi:hypothetical protein
LVVSSAMRKGRRLTEVPSPCSAVHRLPEPARVDAVNDFATPTASVTVFSLEP